MTTSQHKNLAILVGGGPAPGINSVISAATIRCQLEGVEVLGEVPSPLALKLSPRVMTALRSRARREHLRPDDLANRLLARALAV